MGSEVSLGCRVLVPLSELLLSSCFLTGCMEAFPEHLYPADFHPAADGRAQPRRPSHGRYRTSAPLPLLAWAQWGGSGGLHLGSSDTLGAWPDLDQLGHLWASLRQLRPEEIVKVLCSSHYLQCKWQHEFSKQTKLILHFILLLGF